MSKALVFYAQSVIAKVIGSIIALTILARLFWSFIRSPVKFVRETFKRRDEMPACLNDPSLGSHGFLHLEDVKLHYVSCGDESKPLMLCLHGFPEFWYSWRYMMQEFSKDYRVVAVDMRGYGDSDKPSGWRNYVIEKISNDIKQLIPALGHKSCTVLSHDWGGAIAWYFTAMNPDLVDKLVVFNCPHPAAFQKYLRSNRSQLKKSWYMFFFQIPWVPELFMMANNMKFFDLVFGNLPNQKLSREDIDAYKYAFSAKGCKTAAINYYRAAFSKQGEKIPQIVPPTLIVWGEPDMALNTELAYLSANYVTKPTVKTIKDTNHFVTIDKPQECVKLVREFLKSG